MPAVRRLAAILAADVAGYSRLMGVDEEGTHERLQAHFAELAHPKIEEHRGRVVKNTGDGFLAEFASVVDAVRCAVEMQRGMTDREPDIPEERRIRFRVGVNVGDIIVESNDIFGDGVNVAARLEGLAEPGGVCVSRMVRDNVRDKVDYTFEDLGEQQVKNIARPVRVYEVRADRAVSPPSGLRLLHPDKPSIAVLPFQNMSGDPEREYFVDGMVEEIITALSRIRWLFVIARNSSFTYKGRAIDVKQVGRELGVRYVLEGSVRKAGGRVRITAQLIEADTGAHLWADTFDGSLDDVFDLQDQVATGVSGVIEPTLREAEGKRSARRPTNDQTAYDLYLRAWPLMSTWAKEPVAQALGLLERAIDRDPRYGPALAVAAFCYSQRVWSGWTDDPEKERGIGIERARQALQYARHDPNVVFMAAGALADFGDDIAILTGRIDNALARNPSSALGWFWSGWMRIWSGDAALAIEHFETSLRLDPRATRRAFHLTGMGIAQFFQRRFDDAAATLQASLHEVPSYPTTARILAACYAHMGRLDDARALVARLVDEHTPTPTQWSIFGNQEQRELVLSGLRLAMGEER
jgi:TolB-like protein/class 3 adenylate cyclase